MSDSATPRRPRPWLWFLAFLGASAAGFALLIGVGCMIGANSCPFGEQERVTATDGPTIFARSCALCHGVDGTGGQGGPTLVEGDVTELTLDELVAKIARGRPFAGMPRFKNELDEAQLEAVAAYVMSLREETP